MTIEELIQGIKNSGRFYSKNTSIKCQEKIIAALEKEFGSIKKITPKDDQEGFEDITPYRVVIIQEADKILGELKDFNSLKRLKDSNAAFVLFFNNKSDYYKYPDGWFEFLQDEGHRLYEKTFLCSKESQTNEIKNMESGNRNHTIFGERLKKVSMKVISFFEKSPVKMIFIFLILFGIIWIAINRLSPAIDTTKIEDILISAIGSIIATIVIAIVLIIVKYFRSK